MFKAIMEAIGSLFVIAVVLLGALVLCGMIYIAWPILLFFLVIGLPFLIIGICTGKKKNKK